MEGDALSFAEYLTRLRARSALTADAYQRDLATFADWCKQRGNIPEDSLTRARVGLYLMDRTGGAGPVSPRSAARAVSALKAWGQYLAFTGRLDAASLEGLLAPRYSRKLPAYLNVDEVRRIVCAYDGDARPASLRNAAILHILYAAGLRVSECAGLRISSVRQAERLATVFGKGRREREVPYGQRAADAMSAYLAKGRPQLVATQHARTEEREPPGSATNIGAADSLWLNRRGGRLSARSMRTILDRATLLAGSIKPVSPHKLRHACATHMLEGGADVRLLQELLGHQSINTTQVYTQVTRTKLLEAYEKSHPRAK